MNFERKRKASLKDKVKAKLENRKKQKRKNNKNNKSKYRKRGKNRNKKLRKLPVNFLFSHITPIVQIKTRNWFLKIAAIRELVPRLMVEISLFGCLRYIYSLSDMFNYAKLFIQRLRGISNPLIACYCRIFTFQQMFQVFGNLLFENKINMIEKVYFVMFKDMLYYFHSMIENQFKFVEIVYNGIMDSQDYLNIFNSAFDIIFQCIMYQANKQCLQLQFASQGASQGASQSNVSIDHQDIATSVELYLRDKIDKSLLDLIDLKAFLHSSSSLP